MKTEPTINIQNEVAKIHSQFGMTEIANYQIEKLFEMYVKQSSPKIKQLEWWMVAEGTETILANIPFNNYYLIDGVDSMIFLTINSQYHIGRYATIDEAKAAAQKDFEERVEKCIAK